MKSSPKFVSLALLLLVSCLAQIEDVSSSPSQIPSAIKKWCNSTNKPDMCIAAISPFLKGKPDLNVAVSIAINSALKFTNTAILAVKAKANSPITPPALKSVLKDTLISLHDGVSNFNWAQEALSKRDWGRLNSMLSGAITAFGECEDYLSGQNVPILIDFSKKGMNMATNCIDLSCLLAPHSCI